MKRLKYGLLIVCLLVLSGGQVLAQAEPDPVETVRLTGTALVGVLSVALAVGLGGGLAGALLFVRGLRQNETLKLAIERLYLSASPETQRLIRGGVELGRETIELADDVTDGVLPD